MQEIQYELYSLAIFIITGFIVGILFDIFRIMRKSFKTANWITYVQDILFWILTGLIVLFSIFQFNYGEVRSYVFFGIILGVILYMLTISKYFIKYSIFIISYLKNLISYPLNFIKKAMIKPIRLVIKQTYKIWMTICKKKR